MDIKEKRRAGVRREVAKAIVRADLHGSSLEKVDPARAAAVLEKLAEAVPVKRICRELGVDRDAVTRMRLQHAAMLNRRKELMAEDAMELAEQARQLQMEKMAMLAGDEEELRKVNLRDLAIPYGIYADKFMAATEGNRVVVEHKSGAPSLEDAVKAIEAAKAALKKASVEVSVTEVEGNK